ncbi:MAG TPA: 16S rRNA (cytidine(1402)-2'-O)-methyltransferase [Steroidobacteraceae bacterium]|nr:16S rRNA (cytidine(1402)-2'-O)-methyltransferase [Steroidobacteraceae bacterium]
MVKAPGRLLVVATPIGNLADLSPRALEALGSAALIAAEDTRHTRLLLQAAGVSTALVSLHAHNESQRVAELLERLADGMDVALVSDAGTPLLSDPGFELVSRAAAAGFAVHTIPGPSAITAALSVAGLPTHRFCFEGFLPARAAERRAALAQLAHETRTLVFFEAPHRIEAALADMAAHFGPQRRAAVARELTKTHETIYRGTLGQLHARAQAEQNFARGELTVVVAGAADGADAVDAAQLRRTMDILLRELPPGRAAATAAALTGAPRAAAYALAATRDAAAAPPADEEMP